MNKKEILFGLIVALFLAVVLSPFASPWPDGLEKVAKDKGFLEKKKIEPTLPLLIPDYAWPGLKNNKIATSLAGITGTLIIFGISYGLAALMGWFRKK